MLFLPLLLEFSLLELPSFFLQGRYTYMRTNILHIFIVLIFLLSISPRLIH